MTPAGIDPELWGEFLDAAEYIAQNPETAYEEHEARKTLSTWLRKHGFEISDVDGLDTAFVARYGEGAPNVAILLEYDALPGIGHACGHQLIGAGGALAGILAARQYPGTGSITIIGCPAEESGGGKAALIEAGVFEQVTTAMMFHPASVTLLARSSVAALPVSIEFHGRSSHTARAPEYGRNALSSAILLFNGIDALRQRLGRWATISGIIAEGGTAVNVVPEYSRVELILRDETATAVAELLEQVKDIAHGAALAVGTRADITPIGYTYSERRSNRVMLTALAKEMRRHGIDINQPRTDEALGSSDIGNVSLVVPTIHPTINVAPTPTPSHSLAFEEVCRQPRAHAATGRMASSLAGLALRLLTEPDLVREAQDEFARGGYDAPGVDFTDLAGL